MLCNVVVLNRVSSCFSVAVDTDGPFWHKFGFSGCLLFEPAVKFPYKQVLWSWQVCSESSEVVCNVTLNIMTFAVCMGCLIGSCFLCT